MLKNRTMKELMAVMPQVGKVAWISRRTEKRGAIEVVEQVEVTPEDGLIGDHYKSTSKKRQVTLIQGEHLDAVANILGIDKADFDATLTRRNIIVRGLNLLALKEKQFTIGTATLEMTGLCHPCSRMEDNFGAGGYNAMRGHGGITTRVIEAGTIKLGDEVRLK